MHAEKQLLSFGNALDQQVIVLHVRVDFVDWKVNQHTGNLGCLVACKTLHKGVNDGAHVLFVVGVLLNNRVQDWHCLREEFCVDAALGSHGHRHTTGTGHWHRQACSDWHWHWHAHSHVVGQGGLIHSGLGAVLLVLLLAILVVVALRSVILLVVVVLARSTHLLVLLLAALVVTALGSFATLVGSLLRLLLEETVLHQKSEQVDKLVRISNIGEGTCVLSLVALEVLLVLLGLVVHVTVLLDLVVVDVQGLVVDLLLSELGLSGGGLVGGLVADEGEGVLLVFDWEELE